MPFELPNCANSATSRSMQVNILLSVLLAFVFTNSIQVQNQSRVIRRKQESDQKRAAEKQQDKNSDQREKLSANKKSDRDIQTSLGVVGPIRVQIMPDMIVVTGTDQEEVKRVEALIRKMIASSIKTLPKNHIYKLKNAHAAAVAPWVQHLFDKNFAGRQGKVTVTAKSQSEILIIGAPAAIDEAIKIAKSLDK